SLVSSAPIEHGFEEENDDDLDIPDFLKYAGMSSTLSARLETVRSGIADAARAAGRDPAEVTTIVVTKFHPASLVRELFELGVRDVGENRHQEAEAKAAELADLTLAWHFVGQL